VNVSLPARGSAVIPLLSRFVGPSPPDANGSQWFIPVTLAEVAGVGTRVTSFIVAGQDGSSLIPSGGNLPAKGSMVIPLAWRGAQPPFTFDIVIGGGDGSGGQWKRQASVTLTGGDITQFVHVNPGGLTNGASFVRAYAPGMLTTAFGTALASST